MKEKEITREEDKDIENETSKFYYPYTQIILELSMIIGTLLNSTLSYMSMHHFEEALKTVNFIIDKNYWRDPEIYFRKAQVTDFLTSNILH